MTGDGERRGPLPEDHWSRSREGLNEEALEYMRERSKAPGVESGGAERNHYCMECNGVIPLVYDRRQAHDPRKLTHCPHCGAKLDERVQAMFNWVEIDQVRDSDAKALLPFALGALVLLGLGAVLILRWLF
ncbi:MAG: hypothetical protein AAFZ65_06170 [Planctomycetota bacterium]